MINELVRAAPLQEGAFSLWHWTGRDGREIDVLAECRRRLIAFEIKASASISNEDLRHLRRFAEKGPGKGRRVTSILLYLGTEPVVLGERMVALPVSMLWAHASPPS